MGCMSEISTAKFPPLQLSILFFRQPQLSQGMARPTMTIFGASETFEGETFDGCTKTRRPQVSATIATASVSLRDRSMKGLLRSLCISSGYPQQKLRTLRGAPKYKLATEMSPTSSSDPCITTNICASTPPQKRQVPESCGDRVLVVSSPYAIHEPSPIMAIDPARSAPL